MYLIFIKSFFFFLQNRVSLFLPIEEYNKLSCNFHTFFKEFSDRFWLGIHENNIVMGFIKAQKLVSSFAYIAQ